MLYIQCGVPDCIRHLHRLERCYLHFVQYKAKLPSATVTEIEEYERLFDRPMGRVYAVLCEESSAVKIGVSDDPERRVSRLQCANPHDLILLGYVDGGHDLERKIHKYLADYRMRGEWFRYEGDAKLISDAIVSGNLINTTLVMDDYGRA